MEAVEGCFLEDWNQRFQLIASLGATVVRYFDLLLQLVEFHDFVFVGIMGSSEFVDNLPFLKLRFKRLIHKLKFVIWKHQPAVDCCLISFRRI